MSKEEDHVLDQLWDLGARNVLVAFSGGKDSLVTLDLCIKRFGKKNVVGFFWYLVKGLECEERFLRFGERRYGIKVIRTPSHNLIRALRHGVYCRPYRRAGGFPAMTQGDAELYIRNKTGIDWIAWGHRVSDSIARMAMLKKVSGIDVKYRHVYPVWDWKSQQIYAYMRLAKIPLPDLIDGNRSGGVSLSKGSIEYLRAHHPRDLARLLRVFPFAEALLLKGTNEKV